MLIANLRLEMCSNAGGDWRGAAGEPLQPMFRVPVMPDVMLISKTENPKHQGDHHDHQISRRIANQFARKFGSATSLLKNWCWH